MFKFKEADDNFFCNFYSYKLIYLLSSCFVIGLTLSTKQTKNFFFPRGVSFANIPKIQRVAEERISLKIEKNLKKLNQKRFYLFISFIYFNHFDIDFFLFSSPIFLSRKKKIKKETTFFKIKMKILFLCFIVDYFIFKSTNKLFYLNFEMLSVSLILFESKKTSIIWSTYQRYLNIVSLSPFFLFFYFSCPTKNSIYTRIKIYFWNEINSHLRLFIYFF